MSIQQRGSSEIISESRFVLSQLFFILKLPFLIVLVLLKQRRPEELLQPLHDFRVFFFGPRLTVALIAINFVVFISQAFMSEDLFLSLVFTPSDLASLNLLPLIASVFMHANLAHLLGNMLFLFIFGRIIESTFGAFRMVMIYFGSGLIAFIISGLAGQGGIGASGAIAGLIAAAILIRPFYLTYLIMGIPLPIILVGWLAILSDVSGILYQRDDGIGYYAHMGGYLAISLLVFILNKEDRDKMKIGLAINTVFVIAYLIAVTFFI